MTASYNYAVNALSGSKNDNNVVTGITRSTNTITVAYGKVFDNLSGTKGSNNGVANISVDSDGKTLKITYGSFQTAGNYAPGSTILTGLNGTYVSGAYMISTYHNNSATASYNVKISYTTFTNGGIMKPSDYAKINMQDIQTNENIHTDLNSYTTTALYHVSGGYAGSTVTPYLDNCPVSNGGFFLKVDYLGSAGYIKQTIYHKNGTVYTRTKKGNETGWTDWKIVLTQDNLGTGTTGSLVGMNLSGQLTYTDSHNKHTISPSGSAGSNVTSGNLNVITGLAGGTESNSTLGLSYKYQQITLPTMSNYVTKTELSNQAYLPKAGGTVTGNLQVNGVLSNPHYLYQLNGGSYISGNLSTNFTGMIEIKLPAGIDSNPVTMWIDVYNYANNTSFSIFVAGYIRTDYPWNCPTVIVYGSTKKVRLYYNSTTQQHIIYIGDTNTTWKGPRINILRMLQQ